jgi:hypothetical protein
MQAAAIAGYRFDFLHPAATASASVQNHRSPFAVSSHRNTARWARICK